MKVSRSLERLGVLRTGIAKVPELPFAPHYIQDLVRAILAALDALEDDIRQDLTDARAGKLHMPSDP